MEKIKIGLVIVIILFCGVGWILNLVKFLHCDFQAPYKAEVIYGAGIITPIGTITGWINIKD